MKKSVKIIVIILLVLIVGVVAIPFIYKDKIIALVKTEINNNVNAKVDFGEIDLTIFSSFPNLSLVINNLKVVGVDDFATDTLANINQLSVKLNLMSVIKGEQIQINSIKLDKAFINLLVLKDGKANWDIAKADSSTTTPSEPTKFKVALKRYSISDSRIYYNDESMGFKMSMDQLNHEGKGDFTQDLFVLATNTTAGSMNLWYGGVKYFHNINTKLKADLDMNMPEMKFTFKDNELSLNELALGFFGYIAMPTDDIAMDLKFNAKQNEFKNFISLIPGVYSESFKDVQTSGLLAFNGFVKGTYNDTKMPGFGLTLKINNGKFKYPSLPVGVNDVQVDLNIINPDGVPDHTLINLQRLHALLGSDSFDAKMIVKTPVSDANIDASLVGKINFENIGKIVPLEQGTIIKGIMNSNFEFKGRMSAIEKQDYQNINASGNIALTNFSYNAKDYKQTFSLPICKLTFNPSNVTLNELVANMGSSDISANGTLNNFLPYIFKKQTISGDLNLVSKSIDLADFDSGETATTTAVDTTPMSLIEIPANINFNVNAEIGKLKYDNVVLDQFVGKLILEDQKLSISNLNFNTVGGSCKMSGFYSTKVRNEAEIAYDLDILNFDIQQTNKKFATAKKLAPIIERATGSYSTSFNIIGKLDKNLQPVLSTLTGGGVLSTNNVIISNFPPLVKVAETLKLDQFKQLPLKDVKLTYKFENGRVYTEPFDVNLAGIPSTAKGSTGFDQTIDYSLLLNIPTSKLPSQASNAINELISQANAKGANLKMGETIKVNALIGGTVTSPSIKTDLKSTANNVVNDVKDAAKAELDRQKKELEAKANAEADRLKKEAETKAKAEVDKLKKEAEDKLKKEQEKLKDDVKKKAKDAVNSIFGPKK